MDQIDLFYIPHPEVAERDKSELNKLNKLMTSGKTKHRPTRWHHLFMMSKYFNLFFLPEDESRISDVNNPVIYHIPDGTRSDIHPSVESILSKYKNNIPIVMRSYDPLPPRKLSKEFMTEWHDLSITYLRHNAKYENIKFGKWGYDNHLFGMFTPNTNRNRLACMIHSNRTTSRHNVSANKYKQYGIDLKKTHSFRREIAKNPLLDVFGSGWPLNLTRYRGKPQPFDQKYTTLKKYKFNVITLPAIAEDYIDEKILDSFLTLTVPVVLGPDTLDDYFPEDSYININDFSSINSLFSYLNNMSDKKYFEHIHSIKNNRAAIFDDFSTKENHAKMIYDWYRERYSGESRVGFDSNNIDDKIKNLELRRSNDTLAKIKRNARLSYKKIRYKFKI